MATPSSNQLASLLAHRHRHLDRALRRVGTRHRIVEEDHDAVAGELIECPLKLADEWPQCAVIFTQEVENLLGLGGFREGGVAAQVTEDGNDVTAVAFEDALLALRDDHLCQLWRKEALQSADAAELLDLLGDPRFQAPVQFGDLIGPLPQFAKQARILHSND